MNEENKEEMALAKRHEAPSLSAIQALDQLAVQVRKATDMFSVMEMQTQAKAFEHWVRARAGADALARKAAVIVLRAERRIGQLSAKIPVVPPPGPGRTNPKSKGAILEAAGITKRRASSAERVAEVHPKTFEHYVNTAKRPTVGGLLVDQGLRSKYEYPAALQTWRAIALDAVALLESSGAMRGETLALRRRCSDAMIADRKNSRDP